MNDEQIHQSYQELQRYIAWSEDDVSRVTALGRLIESQLPDLIEDFYAEIQRQPNARAVLTGGHEQIERLKDSLLAWLQELLSGTYDREYVLRRWRVGRRHVEIDLNQVYANAALSRLRSGLSAAVCHCWNGETSECIESIRSVSRLLDLDLMLIQQAYDAEKDARLQRSERLAAIGQVAGGIAHEIRNPLNGIKTSIYYLLNARSPTSEKVGEHLDRISRQVDKANGVVNALSDFARLPVPARQPFSAADCIRDILGGLPTGQLKLNEDLPSDLPVILGDPRQLRIVFDNLIRNACDAMSEDGQLEVSGSKTDGYVRVAVRDNGSGIASEHIANISEPLFTTKARGIGLGLAITRAILERHGGHLEVESEEGRGSTFTVVLPVPDG